MNKQYTIEVPIYSSPLEHLIELNRLKDINIAMYGGVPNSPLNGGRYNHSLDGLFLWDKLSFSVTKNQLSRALSNFYKTLTKANQNNIPFRLAYTNMFICNEELNEENLYPVQWLVESSQKYGVKNGLILNNMLLENFIRQKYKDTLSYVSSCTKYVSPHKILTPDETLNMYLNDSGKYDFIVLTPQDSRREELLRAVVRDNKNGIIAICNSYCSDNCNSYYHYEHMSKENKRSLLTMKNMDIFVGILTFMMPHARRCSGFRQPFCKIDIKKMAEMQLNAGIVNFKLGRGFGANLIDELASLILKFKETHKSQ